MSDPVADLLALLIALLVAGPRPIDGAFNTDMAGPPPGIDPLSN